MQELYANFKYLTLMLSAVRSAFIRIKGIKCCTHDEATRMARED